MGTAAGTVLGTNYPKLWLGGLFSVGGTAILPADGIGKFALTFPFAIREDSFLFGFTDSMRIGRVFTLNLSGSGIATMTTTRVPSFNPSDPALYDTRSVSFDFGANSPSPTPEPASIFLFGSAIAIMARATRRRGSRS